MTENKRFLLKYGEYETSNGEIITVDPYFIDTKGEYVDEDNFTIDGYLTMEDTQVVDLLNDLYEENEQLKKRNNELIGSVHFIHDEKKRLVNKYVEKIKEVEKENEQLKEHIEKLSDYIEELGGWNDRKTI